VPVGGGREHYRPESGFAPHAEACRSGSRDRIDIVEAFKFRESILAECWCSKGPLKNECVVWGKCVDEYKATLSAGARLGRAARARADRIGRIILPISPLLSWAVRDREVIEVGWGAWMGERNRGREEESRSGKARRESSSPSIPPSHSPPAEGPSRAAGCGA
jgi:hypothetical protein